MGRKVEGGDIVDVSAKGQGPGSNMLSNDRAEGRDIHSSVAPWRLSDLCPALTSKFHIPANQVQLQDIAGWPAASYDL